MCVCVCVRVSVVTASTFFGMKIIFYMKGNNFAVSLESCIEHLFIIMIVLRKRALKHVIINLCYVQK